MKLRSLAAATCCSYLLVSAAAGRAQNNPEQKAPTPLKITIVMNEFDGQKKIASLPYAFFVTADAAKGVPDDTTRIRAGMQIPIRYGPRQYESHGVAVQEGEIQYETIGTNVDCSARSAEDNRFLLNLSLSRKYLYDGNAGKPTTGTTGAPPPSSSSAVPILEAFSSSYQVYVRQGETLEATSTTDPFTGHVLQILVTASAVK
jgi:hypothetical protein